MEKLEAVILLSALVEQMSATNIGAQLIDIVAPHVDAMEAVLDEKPNSDVELTIQSATTKLINIIINGN